MEEKSPVSELRQIKRDGDTVFLNTLCNELIEVRASLSSNDILTVCLAGGELQANKKMGIKRAKNNNLRFTG